MSSVPALKKSVKLGIIKKLPLFFFAKEGN